MAKPPNPPYIPAKYKGEANNKPIKLIVMHGTVSATKKGGARSIASYFQHPSYEASAHYVVDPAEVIQCVYDSVQAWHCGRNQNSIGVELCDVVDGPVARWKDKDHQAMLRVAARLVRQLCDAYDVPKRHITPEQMRAGAKGICGHSDVRDAWPGSTTHHDPGAGFPWEQFMRLVNDAGPVVPDAKVTLKPGDEGPMVEWLQGQLNADLQEPPGIPVTGVYDATTRAGVARFQREQRLGFVGTRWLGIAGPKTIARLKSYSD